jgi:hypothetical protein
MDRTQRNHHNRRKKTIKKRKPKVASNQNQNVARLKSIQIVFEPLPLEPYNSLPLSVKTEANTNTGNNQQALT